MSDYFAAFLDLRGRRSVVVGGGEIGERKALALLDAGSGVTVVSPTVTDRLAALAAAQRIDHRSRCFRSSDLSGASLAVAATGDAVVDARVAAAARRLRVLVNAVDRPELCDFILPSVLRRGPVRVAVSTGGKSPALAREIRRHLERLLPRGLGPLAEAVGRARARARAAAATPEARRDAAERVVAKALARVLPAQPLRRR